METNLTDLEKRRIALSKEKGYNACPCGVTTKDTISFAFHFCPLEDKEEDYFKEEIEEEIEAERIASGYYEPYTSKYGTLMD